MYGCCFPNFIFKVLRAGEIIPIYGVVYFMGGMVDDEEVYPECNSQHGNLRNVVSTSHAMR